MRLIFSLLSWILSIHLIIWCKIDCIITVAGLVSYLSNSRHGGEGWTGVIPMIQALLNDSPMGMTYTHKGFGRSVIKCRLTLLIRSWGCRSKKEIDVFSGLTVWHASVKDQRRCTGDYRKLEAAAGTLLQMPVKLYWHVASSVRMKIQAQRKMKGQQVTSLALIEPSGQWLTEAQPVQCFLGALLVMK